MYTGWTLLAAAALGAGPYGSSMESYGEVTSSGVSGGYGDQLYTYERQDPWLHGYFQEIPAYGGYHSFRPYNYKHVLSQSQTAAGFGMSPVMPYSQQFWHRYENRANLSPYANEPGGMTPGMAPMPMGPAPMGPMNMGPMPNGMPSEYPGVGMTAPGPFQPVMPTAATVTPAEWNRGPLIVPANGEARSPETSRSSRWGRFAERAGQ